MVTRPIDKTITTLVIGAAIGGLIAVGIATLADNANSARIDSMSAETADWRISVTTRLSSIERQIAIVVERQSVVQRDVAEIKTAMRAGGGAQ